jgi:hypothetical protein
MTLPFDLCCPKQMPDMEFLCYVSALGLTVSVLWLDATGSMTIPTFFLMLLQHFNDSLATCFGAL